MINNQSITVTDPSIDVAMGVWSPVDSFDWVAFGASMSVATAPVAQPEFDADGNIITIPNTVTSAPNDPDSGWDPATMAFITNANGETADFHVAYDAAGVAHYTVPDGTDAIYAAYLQENFADWL